MIINFLVVELNTPFALHPFNWHLKYIKDLVGIDYIGLGTDFDGMADEDAAKGVEKISLLNNIVEEMKNQCFSCEEIVKVLWKNWYRVLQNAF